MTKAGRFVGLADCYGALPLTDNATILLAVNRMAAFRQNSANLPLGITSHRGSTGRTSATQSCGRGHVPPGARFFHMFLPTSECEVGEELPHVGVGCEDNSKTAQPLV